MKRLVLLSLILLLAVPVFAQGPAFQVSSLPKQMRGEGMTEAVGDLVLQNTTTAAAIQAGSTITVVYSNKITVAPAVGTSVITAINGAGLAGVTAVISGNTVIISFAAAVNLAQFQGLSVTNLRVDASTLAGGGQVTAFVSGSSSFPAQFPITFTNPSVIVGLVTKPSMVLTTVSPSSSNTVFTSKPPVTSFVTCATSTKEIRYAITEQYPAAFTTTADEQGFTPALSVTNGTIIQAILHGVPNKVRVTLTAGVVPTGSGIRGDTPPSTGAVVVKGDSSNDISSNANIANILLGTSTSANTGTAVAGADVSFFIFFSADNTSAIEDLSVDMKIENFIQAPVSPSPTFTVDFKLVPGPSTCTGSCSPTLNPVVRFADNTIGTSTIGSVGNCSAALLFPWVVVAGPKMVTFGWDTSVAIANTTVDPFGSGVTATPQAGTCTFSLFPTTDPSVGSAGTRVDVTTAQNIAAGGTLAVALSSFNPAGAAAPPFADLEGYMFVVCNFLNPHGFAIVTNGIGTGTPPSQAHGYLALVVPTGTSRSGAQESLGQ